MRHEDNCLWFYDASRCLFKEWMEFIRFYNCSYRVSCRNRVSVEEVSINEINDFPSKNFPVNFLKVKRASTFSINTSPIRKKVID